MRRFLPLAVHLVRSPLLPIVLVLAAPFLFFFCFSLQFVKYLDAEVNRLEEIVKKKGTLGGGDEVLNVIKIVRTRVCAQVDLMMGEDVAILTRMLSYDDRYMMRAALRAGDDEKGNRRVVVGGGWVWP